jgi:4-diphosphocytidyl-2-C-methyl-D-erythritol kinase
MIAFPPCKINLGLQVIRKRPDGFHDLESCCYHVPWTDILEIIPSADFSFTSSGLAIPGSTDSNLCVRAWQLLSKDFKIPPVSIHLHKTIPTGAGLGGGSSDGAHTLRLLNTIFDLNLDGKILRDYASQLGSDCAFFIYDNPMLGTERGNVLSDISVSLKNKFLAVIKPQVHVSTAEAYAGIIPRIPEVTVRNIIEGFVIEEWKQVLKNDFEETVFKKYPEISLLKENLYAAGALYASMSGSGSAVFGIFDHPADIEKISSGNLYWSGVL